MKRISIIPNKHKEVDLKSVSQIVSIINENGATALLGKEFEHSRIGAEYVENAQLGDADMLIVLGGDGTILEAARSLPTRYLF